MQILIMSKAHKAISGSSHELKPDAASVTFEWDDVAILYWVRVGYRPGASELLYKLSFNNFVTLDNLPNCCSIVFVRVSYMVNGAWQYKDVAFANTG